MAVTNFIEWGLELSVLLCKSSSKKEFVSEPLNAELLAFFVTEDYSSKPPGIAR